MTLVLFLFTLTAFSQPGRFGTDSLGCLNSLSVMSEFVKMELYDEAYDAWKNCFVNCPSSSKNIYVAGPGILYYKIGKTADIRKKEDYIDTLMLLYDRRIELFGQEGYVTARKAIDILKYRSSEYPEAYYLFKRSVSLEKLNSEAVVLSGFMQVNSAMYKSGKIQVSEAVENYVNIMGSIYNSNSIPDDQKKKYAETINDIMAESGAANCETIGSILLSEPDSISSPMLMSIIALMGRTGCNDSTLMTDLAENILKTEPGKDISLFLAEYFFKSKDYRDAAKYYYEALNFEHADDSIANIYYNLSLIEQQQKDFRSARSLALKALEYKPDMGEAYISIGLTYISSGSDCGSDALNKASVYWAAVDKFIMAKKADPGLADKADELITLYSKYFPDNDTIFFYGLSEGKEYTVGCWINEKTIVRGRQ